MRTRFGVKLWHVRKEKTREEKREYINEHIVRLRKEIENIEELQFKNIDELQLELSYYLMKQREFGFV